MGQNKLYHHPSPPTTNHPQPPTTIHHHHPRLAKIYQPSPTTSQNMFTTTHHYPKNGPPLSKSQIIFIYKFLFDTILTVSLCDKCFDQFVFQIQNFYYILQYLRFFQSLIPRLCGYKIYFCLFLQIRQFSLLGEEATKKHELLLLFSFKRQLNVLFSLLRIND